MSRILDMQRLKGSTDSCILAAITNNLLNMIISHIMLINMNRLATYANHAGYDLNFFHDYKIVNVIREYIMQMITTSHVSLCLNTVNKPSSITEDVIEIQIVSQPCKGNNLTHERHEGKRVTTFRCDYQRVSLGPTPLLCNLPPESLMGTPWVARHHPF
jgi:hypothetical protein